MEKLSDKLKNLSNKELLVLSDELRQTSVPENSLLRKIIKNTEMDTTAPMIAFMGVAQLIGFELAERLKFILEELNSFDGLDVRKSLRKRGMVI